VPLRHSNIPGVPVVAHMQVTPPSRVGQTFPHLPQLLVEVAKSTQAFVQQAGAIPVHTVPHLPQLFRSLGTHVPLQHNSPLAQGRMASHMPASAVWLLMHMPALHVSVLEHALPHMPQFFASVFELTHWPPQHLSPAAQVFRHAPQF
jgi:hypothetical protein